MTVCRGIQKPIKKQHLDTHEISTIGIQQKQKIKPTGHATPTHGNTAPAYSTAVSTNTVSTVSTMGINV